jgi:ectoine hydroxylase-related dioxygenase (phytanoyl-CoA dioxygenase family)
MKTIPQLFARGFGLDLGEHSFGELRRSDEIQGSAAALRERFDEDGYLFIPGFFDREDVVEIRREMTGILEKKNVLDPSYPSFEAVKREGADMTFLTDPRKAVDYMNSIVKGIGPLKKLLYSGPIIEFFRAFFGEPVRHFDFTWVRTMGKGPGTEPHCDVVYMGRGTSRVCTSWIPYGDISYEIGGLMILENSHKQGERLSPYLHRDVDKYCTNRPEAKRIETGEIPWKWNGVLSTNPVSLREHLGGRWLTTEYRMGDLLVFGLTTVHGSLDNQTSSFRLSTDTRYQPASEPIDERWVGENPAGHGLGSKRGYIC